MEADYAFNGEDALEKFNQRLKEACCARCKPYRVMYVDVNMPIMDGYQFARIMKQKFKENPQLNTPMVACSAHVGSNERDKAFESGFDNYLTKPVSKKSVNETLIAFKI